MDGVFSLINLIFLALAVAVLLRLRSVLGRRTGHERPPPDASLFTGKQEESPPEAAPPPQLPQPADADAAPAGESPAAAPSGGMPSGGMPSSAVQRGLKEIALADRSFDAGRFLEGARIAYEQIVAGFAAGDRARLGALLGEDAYRSFDAVMQAREKRRESAVSELVALPGADIEEAVMRGLHARITVRFSAEILSFVRDGEGKTIEGDGDKPQRVEDIWTFERNIRDRDPNWRLVKTGGAQGGAQNGPASA